MKDSSVAWFLPIGLREKCKVDCGMFLCSERNLNERPQRSYSLKTCSSSATVIGLKYNSSILVLGGRMGSYLLEVY
jgi:hypothetical protein